MLSIPSTTHDATRNLEYLLSDQATEDQIREYLLLRPIHEASAEELVGYVHAVWPKRRIADFPECALDIVGTGGVGKPRYNVSTTCAFILASLGVSVAKHGNKGSKEPNGSFNFIEALGFDLEHLTQHAIDNLHKHHLTFLFARDWHPCFKQLASVRASLGQPSVFNLLGPLLNPASPKHTFLGCSSLELAPILADALLLLGRQGTVVAGHDGLDELTLSDATSVYRIGVAVTHDVITPGDLGMDTLDAALLQGGSGQENANVFLDMIQGKAPEPLTQLVVANASYILADIQTLSFTDARDRIEKALRSGLVTSLYQAMLSPLKA